MLCKSLLVLVYAFIPSLSKYCSAEVRAVSITCNNIRKPVANSLHIVTYQRFNLAGGGVILIFVLEECSIVLVSGPKSWRGN